MPNHPKPPPLNRTPFDPWNSSSTGHQRAENRLSGSPAWNASRTRKLAAQFGGDATGGARLADTVGAGSEDCGRDGRTENGGFARGASGLRERGQRSLWECVGRNGEGSEEVEKVWEGRAVKPERREKPPRRIFDDLVFYVNGSTYPLISDHKLKHLVVQHGGVVSVSLARRSVTHVVIGEASGGGTNGAGGGLAAGKIQKEIGLTRGRGIRFVSAAWVVESVRAGRRVPEGGFARLKMRPGGQRGVDGMIGGGS